MRRPPYQYGDRVHVAAPWENGGVLRTTATVLSCTPDNDDGWVLLVDLGRFTATAFKLDPNGRSDEVTRYQP